MYYIDDGHNIASRKTQMWLVGLGIPGTQGLVMAFCKPSELCNTKISMNLTTSFNLVSASCMVHRLIVSPVNSEEVIAHTLPHSLLMLYASTSTLE